MREFVEFVAYGEYGKVGSPPGWPEIAVAALRPLGPKVINPWPVPDSWPHGVTFEFDYYPEGFRDDPGPAPAPGPQRSLLGPLRVHRCGATPGGVAHPGRWEDCTLGRGHAALGGGFDLPLLRLPDG